MGSSTFSDHLAKKALTEKRLQARGNTVRVIAEVSLDRRPMSQAHARWLKTLGKDRLRRDIS